MDRFHSVYGTPTLPADEARRQYNKRLLAQRPVKLGGKQRAAVELAVRETCRIRNWRLWAFNIRTNHVHTVVTASCDPELVLVAIKANATRRMKEAGCWSGKRSPWVRRGSKRYLWTDGQSEGAIAHVLYDQGEPLD